MNKEKALEYCYLHKNEFISDMYSIDEDGERAFKCLIELLESESITGNDLGEYGMDYR